LSTINRMYVSIAIVGRPSVNTARPVCSNSRRQHCTTGHNNSGSHNSTSSAARSTGNSLTSTGNDSSHNDSACGAKTVSINSLSDRKTHHLQGILTVTPDGRAPKFFRGK
jgi:hypothetical protein